MKNENERIINLQLLPCLFWHDHTYRMAGHIGVLEELRTFNGSLAVLDFFFERIRVP